VPLNETAIRQLRDSATALDLYTWLAYRLPRINGKKPATLSWQQLAVHFGNDRSNIRKFRQTIRDAWERHVSAVYPEAQAEFDTTVIKLHASPAPLQQKLIALGPFPPVTDDKSTPARTGDDVAPSAMPDTAADRFMAALTDALGSVQSRVWLKKAALEEVDGDWVLLTDTAFIASWIASHFDQALDRAAAACGLPRRPAVRCRRDVT
jgi:replication initiator protein